MAHAPDMPREGGDSFEARARAKLGPAAYGYFAGGAADEVTLRDNVDAFRRLTLSAGSQVHTSDVDLATTLLGSPVAMPIGLSPVALQGLADPDGERIGARAAARAKIAACFSTLSSQPLESMAAQGDGTRWFQLYVLRDRDVTRQLVERAAASGYKAIVLTVDLPAVGYRDREIRDPLYLKGELGNMRGFPESDFRTGIGLAVDPSLNWSDLAWVRSLSSLPLVIKGILDPADARQAVNHGIDAIVVSNHGARQLDQSIASIDALPGVVEAVAGRAEVYLDGGVRDGRDVAVALALGARAAFIGRPYVFAMAAAGESGVSQCIADFGEQLRATMAASGTRSVSNLRPNLVVRT
jgi:4-hydroxymandelate oxidase